MKIEYDPEKSDIYALGVTLIEVIFPNKVLNSENNAFQNGDSTCRN